MGLIITATYVILVDLDAYVKHLTVSVRIGVITADHFTGAGECRVRHLIVMIIGRPTGFGPYNTHVPNQHDQRQ